MRKNGKKTDKSYWRTIQIKWINKCTNKKQKQNIHIQDLI